MPLHFAAYWEAPRDALRWRSRQLPFVSHFQQKVRHKVRCVSHTPLYETQNLLRRTCVPEECFQQTSAACDSVRPFQGLSRRVARYRPIHRSDRIPDHRLVLEGAG